MKKKNILFLATLSIFGLNAMDDWFGGPDAMRAPETPEAEESLRRFWGFDAPKKPAQSYSLATHDLWFQSFERDIDSLDVASVHFQDAAFVAAYQQQYCGNVSIFGPILLTSSDPKSTEVMDALLKKGAVPRGVIRTGNLDMFNDVGLVLDPDPVFRSNMDSDTRYKKLELLVSAGAGPVARIQQREYNIIDYVREHYANKFSAEQIENLQAACQAGIAVREEHDASRRERFERLAAGKRRQLDAAKQEEAELLRRAQLREQEEKVEEEDVQDSVEVDI